MKTLLIFNPISGGRSRQARFLPLLRDFVSARGNDTRLAVTEGPGHATELAREGVRAGCERVIAVGGDGTLNETAQSLVRTPAALGLVPCGSGNGLARFLRLPSSPLAALKLAGNGHARVGTIDTGLASGKPFFNAMGLGLDADVSERFNRLKRRGLPAYARVVIATFRALKPVSCTISTGDRRLKIEALLVAVANSDQYGNNARIAPGAKVDDGQLDLVALPPTPLWRAPALAARLFLGTLDRSPGVVHWRGTRFRIERAGPGLIHTDGETHAAPAVVDVEILPSSLRILLPPP